MKDYLQTSYWENLPVKNPTQTRYTRFFKSPGSGLISPYTKAISKYNDISRNWNKTMFTEIMEE